MLTLGLIGALSALQADPAPGTVIRDCETCPEMVVVPAGRFTIGSPASEAGRGNDEGPQLPVEISRPFAMSRFEVTRRQYEAFLAATGQPVGGGCITDRRVRGDWQPDAETSVRDPGFAQSDSHPVACVSWNDALAYVAWLNRTTPGGYRLPSEAEWEYAARAGVTSAYLWGDERDGGCRHMNGSDLRLRGKYPERRLLPDGYEATCDDGALNTAPVGSYLPNRFGLYDMSGNVGEWTADCESPDYAALPRDGTPATGSCERRMMRGGSWGTQMRQLRLAERFRYADEARDDSIGIRLVLTLPRGSATPGD